jgi:CO/xanthine dehydrogenase Mo-binding subunit
MSSINASRRLFIKQCVISGIAVYTAPLLWEMGRAQAANVAPDLMAKWKGGKKPKFRSDGIAKVTGQKVYGRDYRAVDMPGWPDKQGYAYVLRSHDASHIFKGFNLDSLPKGAKPSKVVTADVLAKDGVSLPRFFGEQMLLEKGKTAHYLGHAVAILLFDDFASFRLAKQHLQFNKDVLQYGKKTEFVSTDKDPYSAWRIIREEGTDGPFGEDAYSILQDGLFFPNYKAHHLDWPTQVGKNGSISARGMYYAQQIDKGIKESEWHVLDKEYSTQIVDPVMMEPEAFNGWFDAKEQTFYTVVTCQSPQDFQAQAVEMLNHGPLAGKVKHLVVHSPFIGGGFGAKDHSIFPYYGLVAAMYAGKPVRLANDRFEQFQSGLKRHPFKMKNRLAVDKTSLKIQALTADITVDGGGRVNFTESVTMVGASALQSIYYIPRNDIQATAYASRNPDSGSMRGYGTLQTMSAMETMMNETAGELAVDAIDLRLANVMESGQRNTQGAIPNGALRYREILESAKLHDLWVNQREKKKTFEAANPSKRYGVGFGIATKKYGTGAASPSACVRLTIDGRIELDVCFMEMGTGTGTSQAVVVGDILGSMADEITLAEIDAWETMKQVQTDNPYFISQPRQDEMEKNPYWTPVIGMASAASMSSYYQTHATKAAAKVLYRHGLWPAAVSIWSDKYFNGNLAAFDVKPEDGRWVDGKLTAQGYPPLSLEVLAGRAYMMGFVTGAMVHAFNRWAWAEADYKVLGVTERMPIDGLAVRYGSAKKEYANKADGFEVIKRRRISYPKTALNNAMMTNYAPSATMVEVTVNEGNGQVEILSSHTWLETGKVIVKEFVEGQIQGGLAMGVGHALYEYLPPFEDGAGNGTWNLNRYKVPLAKNVGVWKQSHTILPPLSETDLSKGIGEVVIIPIVPALVEAVYQATGVRFYDLPMTAEKIKESLS